MAGRPKAPNLPHDDAMDYVRKHSTARTRKEYQRWVKDNSIPFLPVHPERVYDDWQSWNHFLGTTNSFEKTMLKRSAMKVEYRTWWEAVRYAQQKAKEHNITTSKEWEEWHDSGMCDKDIPKRPAHVYEEFAGKGWGVWLGLTVAKKQVAHMEKIGVVAIMGCPDQPPNVIQLVVDNNGIQSLKNRWDPRVMGKLYRLYKWEPEMQKYVQQLLSRYAFEQDGGQFLVPNMNSLLFELDNLLDKAV